MTVSPTARASPAGRLPAGLAVDETVILLHPRLPLVGVSIVMERGCHQNDSLVNGYAGRPGRTSASPLLACRGSCLHCRS